VFGEVFTYEYFVLVSFEFFFITEDPDSIVLQVCKNQLGVKLNLNDIGRSHPIGQSRDGKISIIVRVLTYRQRAMVFSNKENSKETRTKYSYVKTSPNTDMTC
jgi:hypothetical protein